MNRRHLLMITTCVALAMNASAQTGQTLLGMTQYYGANFGGTIIQYTVGDTTVSKIFSLPHNNALTGPDNIQLTEGHDGEFYGLDAFDGPLGQGTLFQYDYSANSYTIKVNFDNATGDFPHGALLRASNGLLYGLTGAGDSTGGGTLFSYNVGDTFVTKLVTLDTLANPISSLIQASNGRLYGLTNGDGAHLSGTLFQYDITTGAYTVLLDLPGGAYPTGSLIEAGADTLYGVTNDDGMNHGGTLFRYVIGASTDTVLHNFAHNAAPSSELMLASNGRIYGVSNSDGTYFSGTLFSYDIAAGTFTDLHDFGNGNDGATSNGALIQVNDSLLYGMATYGGLNGVGTIYQYNIQTGAYTQKVDLADSTGGNPNYGYMAEYIGMPVIDANPLSLTLCSGDTGAFQAAATGGDITVQWQMSVDGGLTYSNIAGANFNTFLFTAVDSLNGNKYRAVFTNAGVTVDTSTVATLSITSINDSATVSGAVCKAVQGGGATYRWFDCSTGQAISGATSQTFTASATGNYRCAIAFSNCTDTTNCVNAIVSGIPQLGNIAFNLYPNPGSGYFVVDGNFSQPLRLQVAGTLGNIIMDEPLAHSGQQFDISNLSTGLYEVMIRDNGQLLKVIKLLKAE